ncbi:tRNA modification GTPase MnmE [Frankliniella fusca]|uniref:tRNA modification GTPase MnmE n=1 Tax=Frankliniella fusca TaxID=407009 RepID=A0AAE1HYQ8_9NEOP|nr:tRNA modification GTPase MnmE [Frankliniella fusca]
MTAVPDQPDFGGGREVLGLQGVRLVRELLLLLPGLLAGPLGHQPLDVLGQLGRHGRQLGAVQLGVQAALGLVQLGLGLAQVVVDVGAGGGELGVRDLGGHQAAVSLLGQRGLQLPPVGLVLLQGLHLRLQPLQKAARRERRRA